MICELQINFFFRPFGILWYKFLSYIEVLHVLSEPSELSKLSELIELPEVFSSMKKCLFCGALRLGDPLIKLLELRFVSLSSITSHPAFPDEASQPILSSLIRQAHCSYAGCLIGSKRPVYTWSMHA